MPTRITRSILPDLISNKSNSEGSKSIITTAFKTVSKSMPSFSRIKSPVVNFSGTYVDAYDTAGVYALLDINYFPNHSCVGTDIFRAVGDDGTFSLLSTVATIPSGTAHYKDYDVVPNQKYYYYAICFDRKIRFSERSEIIDVSGNEKLSSNEESIIVPLKAEFGTSSGRIMFTYRHHKPFGRNVNAFEVFLVDKDGNVLDSSTEIGQNLSVDYDIAKSMDSVFYKAKSKDGNFITINNSDILAQQDVDIRYFLQELQGVTLDTHDGQIYINIDVHTVFDVLGTHQLIITRRNMTTKEMRFSKPDESWFSNMFDKTHASKTIIDFNTFGGDIYEYYFVARDDHDNIMYTSKKRITCQDAALSVVQKTTSTVEKYTTVVSQDVVNVVSNRIGANDVVDLPKIQTDIVALPPTIEQSLDKITVPATTTIAPVAIPIGVSTVKSVVIRRM